jgi:hypothetical protein
MPTTKEYMQEYAIKNREKLRAYKLAWKKEKMKNPEYRKRQNELEKINRIKKDSVEIREKNAIRTALWKKNNPAKVTANTTQRKKYIKQRTPKWLTEDDKWIIKEAYELSLLRKKMFGFDWHVDHIIPLRGKYVTGLHVPTNLQVIPGRENESKSNKFED